MALTRWNPLSEMATLSRTMEHMLDPLVERDELRPLNYLRAEVFPRVDIYEDKDEILFRAEMPGLERKDVEVVMDDNTLTIRGERKLEREDKHEYYHRIECAYGVFHRAFTLPTSIDHEKIRAEMRNGVLYVHVPKREGARGKPIAIHG